MKGSPDYYYRRSKEEGYPARSVFKLQQIQEKFRIIRRGDRILDMGASPGSWSLYLLSVLAGSGKVTGVDLDLPDQRLVGRRGYRFLHGDFYDPEILASVAEDAPFDLIASDAAPSTIGNRITDTTRSLEMAFHILAVAERHLSPGGRFLVKIFQGGGEKQIMDRMKTVFETAKAFKPMASRRESMEVYLVGIGFRGAAS
jgi:23S rRNA (uridine2552-2'-O)-methyltransferase